MIVFNATFLVAPGQEKPAEKILLAHVEEAKSEAGVLATRVYRSRSEPRRFFIYHELSDPAAFEAHRATRLYGGHILTDLYSMLELESLLMDTYELLEAPPVVPMPTRNVCEEAGREPPRSLSPQMNRRERQDG